MPAKALSGSDLIAAYHKMRPARSCGEHLTQAALLGLDLDERGVKLDRSGVPHRTGPTLRQRIHAYWQQNRGRA